MNIRNTVRNLSMAGVAAALPLLSYAADPNLATDSTIIGDAGLTSGWSSACDANSAGTCADVATGTGFRQETINVGGTTYIRTLVADSSTDEGDFGMETFVQMGGVDGLHGKQFASDPAGTSFNNEGMYMGVTLDTGWANTGTSDGVTITESIVETADDFAVQFRFHENATDLGGTTSNANKQIFLGQRLGNQTGEHQNFNKVEYEGGLPTFSIDVGGITLTDTNANGVAEVTWIGSNFGATFGLEDVASGGPETGNDSFATTGFSGTTPDTANGFDWDTGLGSGAYQPSF
jgi:hypothetical protein